MAATLTELIRLINDVIEKSRRDNLKKQAQEFVDHYFYVLRYGWRHGAKEECKKKEKEVFAHWRDAKKAAEAGKADDLQHALARAEDDLHELAECLGIDPIPF